MNKKGGVPMTEIVARNLDFPEGPAFNRNGDLFVVNYQNGYISKINKNEHGNVQSNYLVQTGGRPNGIAIHQDQWIYVAECGLKSIVKINPISKEVATVVNGSAEVKFAGPNDLCFDLNGQLYFTDPFGSSLENRTGKVYFWSVKKGLQLLFDQMAFPNGVTIDSKWNVLYLAETFTGCIYRCQLYKNGKVGDKELFYRLNGRPDGLCIDENGNVYVALYGSGCVYVISREGKEVKSIPVSGNNPTNVTVHDNYLYITVADTGTVERIWLGVQSCQLFSHS